MSCDKWRAYYRLLFNVIVTLLRLCLNLSLFSKLLCIFTIFPSCFPFSQINPHGLNIGPTKPLLSNIEFWDFSFFIPDYWEVWSINGRCGSHYKMQIITNKIINIRKCRTLLNLQILCFLFFSYPSFHALIWSSTDSGYICPVDVFAQATNKSLTNFQIRCFQFSWGATLSAFLKRHDGALDV